MMAPDVPVTTCSRQVRGMSCGPSRRWDNFDFCGKGKQQKKSMFDILYPVDIIYYTHNSLKSCLRQSGG